MDTCHLAALETRLSHERARLGAAKRANERELRAVWVAQIEKEIAFERDRLGMNPAGVDDSAFDELFVEMFAELA